MTQSTLTVPEISCDACRTTIERALEPVPGVVSVGVDLERKVATVEHDEALASLARLAAVVEGQGYEVTAAERE